MDVVKEFYNVNILLLRDIYNLIKYALYHVDLEEGGLVNAFSKSQLKITTFLSHLIYENHSELVLTRFTDLVGYRDIEKTFSFVFDRFFERALAFLRGRVRSSQEVILILKVLRRINKRSLEFIECIDFESEEISVDLLYPYVDLLPWKYWHVIVSKLNTRFKNMGIEGFDVAPLIKCIERPSLRFLNPKRFEVNVLKYSTYIFSSLSEFVINDEGSVEIPPNLLVYSKEMPKYGYIIHVTNLTEGNYYIVTNYMTVNGKTIMIIPHSFRFKTIGNGVKIISELIRIIDADNGNFTTVLTMLDFYFGAFYSIRFANF